MLFPLSNPEEKLCFVNNTDTQEIHKDFLQEKAKKKKMNWWHMALKTKAKIIYLYRMVINFPWSALRLRL